MKFTISGACAECSSTYVLEHEVQSVLSVDDVGFSLHPPDWVEVTIGINEPIVTPELERILDDMANLGEAGQAYIDFIRKTSPRFKVNLHVCPACRKKGETANLWKVVEREFLRAVEKQLAEVVPPGVLQFPAFRPFPEEVGEPLPGETEG